MSKVPCSTIAMGEFPLASFITTNPLLSLKLTTQTPRESVGNDLRELGKECITLSTSNSDELLLRAVPYIALYRSNASAIARLSLPKSLSGCSCGDDKGTSDLVQEGIHNSQIIDEIIAIANCTVSFLFIFK